jgi:mono/diheme cytochrome c family protein
LAVVGLGYYGGQLTLSGTCVPLTEELSVGAKTYHSDCGACHPYSGNIFNHKMPIIGSPQLKNFPTFKAYNRHPRRPDGTLGLMPPFPPEKISDQDLQQLYDYINNTLQRLR